MGHRPVAPVRIGYEFTYLYLALCPFTGEGYAAFLPALGPLWVVRRPNQRGHRRPDPVGR